MLIGRNDISNDVITLGMCFQCLFTFVLISASRLLAKSDSSVDGEPQENWRWNSTYRDIVASSPSLQATIAMQLKLGRCLPSRAYCHYILVLWPIIGSFFEL